MSFDEKWFNRIKVVNAQLPTRLKLASHFTTKKRFLQDITQEPIFAYRHITDQHLSKKKIILDNLELEILGCSETLPQVKELYVKKIIEKRDQLRLIEVLHTIQITDQKADLLKEAKVLTERIYGAPNQNVFNQIVNLVRSRLVVEWEQLQDLAAHQRLRELFPSAVPTTVSALQQSAHLDYGDVNFACHDAEILAGRFRETLSQAGLQEWRVKISKQKTGGIRVRPRNRYISIPSSGILRNRSNPITEQNLRGLLVHEVMVHARRVEHGRNSGLLLLSIGLDKYWRGEEGVATYYEQRVIGATDYAGFNPYFTAGLAYGLDRGGVSRTFREVFSILRDYFTLCSNKSDLNPDTLAFLSCVRVFKIDPSFVLTRDCVYREGNIAVHQLMQGKSLSDEYLNAGKYDPTNLDHVRCLTELGILTT